MIRRTLAAVGALVAIATALPMPAAAHPLGNFTVNHFTRLTVGQGRIDVHYVLDMAEIPTYTERAAIDTDGDGDVSADEETAYLSDAVPRIVAELALSAGGHPLELRDVNRSLAFPAGQGGLPTMRLELDLTAPLPDGANGASYADRTFRDQVGWREVVVMAGAGMALTRTDVPAESASDELRSYPSGGLDAPMDVTTASFAFEASAIAAPPRGAGGHAPAETRADDPLAALVGGDLTPISALLALALSLGLGVLHALSPGHGKALVAAYLVGGRGSIRDAAKLGTAVAVAHTVGVAGLGAITLLATEARLPELIMRSLSLVAAVTIVALGISLAWPLVRARRRHSAVAGQAIPDHGHAHAHPGGAHHVHPHPSEPAAAMSTRGLLGLGVAGGLVPSASALLVLLVAISLDRVAFGVLMVITFGAGMAIALSAVSAGVVLLRGRAIGSFGRGGHRLGHRVLRLIPVGSAILVVAIGLVMTGQTAAALAVAIHP